MTIKEALTTKTNNLGVSSEELDLALLEAGLDGSTDYTPSTDGEAVDKVWAGLLLSVIRVTEVKEDDVSVKWSTDMKGIYSWLMRKWGMEDPFAPAKPTVRQINYH